MSAVITTLPDQGARVKGAKEPVRCGRPGTTCRHTALHNAEKKLPSMKPPPTPRRTRGRCLVPVDIEAGQSKAIGFNEAVDVDKAWTRRKVAPS